MAKDPTAAKLAALSAGTTPVELRLALRDKSNHVVAKAASLIGQELRGDLEPDLVTAYSRLKQDPQCTGKLAIVKALGELDTNHTDVLFDAARRVQWEPSFGKSVDTAAPLRGLAAVLLAANAAAPLDQVYRTLVDLLNDSELVARSHAARALGQLVHPQTELLLRFKIQSGDPEPEVIGACFDSLLEAAPAQAIAYLSPYLDRDSDDSLAFEAASALGASRVAAAFDLLIERIEQNHPLSDTILRCLTPHRFRPDRRARIAAAVESSGLESLRRSFAREFPES